jgi:hypothetical protein
VIELRVGCLGCRRGFAGGRQEAKLGHHAFS